MLNLTTTLPLLVSLIGAAIYCFMAHPKASEMGRLMFACGLLVALFSVAGHVVRW